MVPNLPSDPAKALKERFPKLGEVAAEYRPVEPRAARSHLLDGQLLDWEGPLSDVSSPVCLRGADGALRRPVLGRVPRMDAAAGLRALDAAARAWDHGRGPWPTMGISARIAAVEAFVEGMLRVREEVVTLMMWEVGKTLGDSRKEFDRTVDYIRQTLAALREADRSQARLATHGGILAQVRRAPLGVCLAMGPFNYPLNEAYTTLFPALLMGNTAVVKPPRHGVLLHQALLGAFASSFPPGVVNFIYGRGTEIISPIMGSGRVDVLAFIGSSRAADALKRQHPKPHQLRSILGLDAKNPALVMPDADLDVAVGECLDGALSFNGQRCTALKLLFVHASVLDDFLRRFCAAVDALPAGMPWQPGVKLTPMPEPDKVGRMRAYVEDAVAHGARVVNESGGVACETLYRPAVVCPVLPGARLYTEEHFGPLVPVCPYHDETEFLDFVAASNYGQQVSLFSSDPGRLGRLIDPLANQVCRINLNAQCQRGPDTLPFTGRKDSAEGTLSITDALRSFSIRSLVAARVESRGLIEEIVARRQSKFLHANPVP